MIRRHGWLLLAAVVAFADTAAFAQGEDPEAKARKLTEAAVKPILPDDGPVFIPGTACRDGRCAPCPQAAVFAPRPRQDHPPFGWYLDRLGKWVFYRAAPTPCECKGHLPAYRPPLHAWFPCKPGHCGPAPIATYGPAIIVEPRPNLPPPLPVTPQITLEERPLIPGSSAAMAEKQPPAKKPAQPAAKTATNPPSTEFRRSVVPATGIMPVEARVVEPRWEKAPK